MGYNGTKLNRFPILCRISFGNIGRLSFGQDLSVGRPQQLDRRQSFPSPWRPLPTPALLCTPSSRHTGYAKSPSLSMWPAVELSQTSADMQGLLNSSVVWENSAVYLLPMTFVLCCDPHWHRLTSTPLVKCARSGSHHCRPKQYLANI